MQAAWVFSDMGSAIMNETPAKSPGMQTVLIRQGYGGHDVIHHEGEIPDATVDSLPELLSLFPSIIS